MWGVPVRGAMTGDLMMSAPLTACKCKTPHTVWGDTYQTNTVDIEIQLPPIDIQICCLHKNGDFSITADELQIDHYEMYMQQIDLQLGTKLL